MVKHPQLEVLAEEKKRILERNAFLRTRMEHCIADLETPIRWLDFGLLTVDGMKRTSVGPLAGVVALGTMAFGFMRGASLQTMISEAAVWIQRFTSGFRVYQGVRSILSNFIPRPPKPI
jgi:hypothetical protein